ncbi:MAG: metalloprotease [Nanoarchaeota archaeon]
MLFTFQEIFDAAAMTFIIGLIFSDFFARYNKKDAKNAGLFVKHGPGQEVAYDPISHYSSKKKVHLGLLSFDWDDLKFAMMIIGPAIILHELGHKFTAMGFGVEATFHTSYFFLGLALLLKILNSPFIFLVPAFVAYPAGAISPLQSSLVAFAGPAVNFLIFIASSLALKFMKKLDKKTIMLLGLTKQVNLFLALFNMIPLRPFDGGHVLSGILQSIGI